MSPALDMPHAAYQRDHLAKLHESVEAQLAAARDKLQVGLVSSQARLLL